MIQIELRLSILITKENRDCRQLRAKKKNNIAIFAYECGQGKQYLNCGIRYLDRIVFFCVIMFLDEIE